MGGKGSIARSVKIRMAYDIVVIGGSRGGTDALSVLLQALPAKFPLAVAVALHRSRDSDDSLVRLLQEHSAMPVEEAKDKEAVTAGRVFLAPPDYHLLLESGSFGLSTGAPVNYARPSLDVLFESAADAYAGRVIGVILTGASSDGARGLARIKSRGGAALVQDPATAEARIMPDAAIAAAPVDWVLPLAGIAPLLTELCRGEKR